MEPAAARRALYGPVCAGTQWFRAVDTDGSGEIDVKELQRALALGKMHFSLAVCRQIIKCAAVAAAATRAQGSTASLADRCRRLYDKTNKGVITLCAPGVRAHAALCLGSVASSAAAWRAGRTLAS